MHDGRADLEELAILAVVLEWRAATTDQREVGAGSAAACTPKAEQPSSVSWVYPAAAENFTLFQSAAYLTATSHMSSSPYDVDTLKPAQVGVS